MAPPTGGPEDKTAPQIVGYQPDSSAVLVPTNEPLVIEFSEKMNRSSVRDRLQIAPWPDKMKCQWKENSFICQPLDGWQMETAYTILLGSLATDRHKNQLANSFDYSFTTGDSLPTGKVVGQLLTRSLVKKGITICLFDWPDNLAPDLLAVPEAPGTPELDPLQAIRITETDSEGLFSLKHVPDKTDFLLGALYDENSNRIFDRGKDLWGFAPERIRPTELDPADSTDTGVQLYLVFSDEPGDISGNVTDPPCQGFTPPPLLRARIDSLQKILTGDLDAQGFEPGADSLTHLALTTSESDSLAIQIDLLETDLTKALTDSLRCSAFVYTWLYFEDETDPFAEIKTNEKYNARSLPPGTYRLEAFRDLNGNKLLDADEPQGRFAFPVELAPGRVVEGIDIELESTLREVDRGGE